MRRFRLALIILAVGFAVLSEPIGPVIAAPLKVAPQGAIEEPKEGAKVRGVVRISGIATHPNFLRYELFYTTWPPQQDRWVLIGDFHYTQQPGGLLGTWDTRGLPDGEYALRLRVVKPDSNYLETPPRKVIVANSEPAETPTRIPITPTPKYTPTPLPSPTPLVISTPIPTPTPLPTPKLAVTGGTGGSNSGGSSMDALRTAFSRDNLVKSAEKGAKLALIAFAIWLLYVGGKYFILWSWRRFRP